MTHFTNHHRQRHGMATFIVVILLSITLVVAYSVMRTQSVASKIQQNAVRQVSARQAAATGMTIALKKMHVTNEWTGVDTTITGRLGQHESYQVTYTTGDPSIAANDPNSPYRVTLLSTGYASDPNTPTSISTHQIRAVVRFVPRALATEPTAWQTMQEYTIYQQQFGIANISPPCHIEGKIRTPLWLTLGQGTCDWSDTVRRRYLSDLNGMRLAGQPDWRPIMGPLEVFLFFQNIVAPGSVDFMRNSLSITVSDTPLNGNYDITHPGAMTSYKLYPGGKTYNTQMINKNQKNKTLQADPETNPLGLFYRNGHVVLKDNVTVRGTIITNGSGELRVKGENVLLEPHDLPPLEDASSPHNGLPIRLPTTITKSNIEIRSGATATINGILTNWGDFYVLAADQDEIDITINGRIFTTSLWIDARDEWKESESWWNDRHGDFIDQLDDDDPELYFPVWLEDEEELDPTPKIVIKPDPTPAYYHWKNLNDPIYAPHPNDTGLRWDLLEWTENPN